MNMVFVWMIVVSVAVVAGLVFLMKWVHGDFTGFSETGNSDFGVESAGRTGIVTAKISPPHEGRVMIGDSEWTAVSDREIDTGAEVRVVSRDNLTMHVTAV